MGKHKMVCLSGRDAIREEFTDLIREGAYVHSQRDEGWSQIPDRYDDGGISGGTMERPALQRLLTDVAAGRIDLVVVDKIYRLTRSLGDFSRIVEIFDRYKVSFVSVTQ